LKGAISERGWLFWWEGFWLFAVGVGWLTQGKAFSCWLLAVSWLTRDF
jgi:hypothetical protein